MNRDTRLLVCIPHWQPSIHKTNTQMRVDILERVKERIKQAPHHFYMHSWIIQDAETEAMRSGYCGTAMCIGGWGMLEMGMSEENLYRRTRNTSDPSEVIDAYAMSQALGLPNTKLFYVDEWPVDLNIAYENAENSNNPDLALLADIACQAIDSYIETNGWPEGYDDDPGDYYDREPNW